MHYNYQIFPLSMSITRYLPLSTIQIAVFSEEKILEPFAWNTMQAAGWLKRLLPPELP